MSIFAMMSNTPTKTITIHAVKVPNPNAMKFEVPGILLTRGGYEFRDAESAKISPLAEKLFKFDYVKQVFISKNFVTVNKAEGSAEWMELLGELRIVIKKHLEWGEPLFLEMPAAKEIPEQEGLARQLKQMLDNQVRPATWEDGGDITFESYEDGVLKVKMAGACIDCPYGPRTVKSGIEVMAKKLFPEVKEVWTDDVNWENTVK